MAGLQVPQAGTQNKQRGRGATSHGAGGQPDPMQTSVSYWGSREALRMADSHHHGMSHLTNQSKGTSGQGHGGKPGQKRGGRPGVAGKVHYGHGFAGQGKGVGGGQGQNRTSNGPKNRPKGRFIKSGPKKTSIND